MQFTAMLEWLNFLVTVDERVEALYEAMGEVAPGHERSTPFVIRCVAAQVFGRSKSSRAAPKQAFVNDPRSFLDSAFAVCVAKEKKSNNPLSQNALKRAGYKGREKQYKAALAMSRQQTAKKREAAGQKPWGPSAGKKGTKWKMGEPAPLPKKKRKRCPRGFRRNPKTGRCVRIKKK
jgi:hypothetical protein